MAAPTDHREAKWSGSAANNRGDEAGRGLFRRVLDDLVGTDPGRIAQASVGLVWRLTNHFRTSLRLAARSGVAESGGGIRTRSVILLLSWDCSPATTPRRPGLEPGDGQPIHVPAAEVPVARLRRGALLAAAHLVYERVQDAGLSSGRAKHCRAWRWARSGRPRKLLVSA